MRAIISHRLMVPILIGGILAAMSTGVLAHAPENDRSRVRITASVCGSVSASTRYTLPEPVIGA